MAQPNILGSVMVVGAGAGGMRAALDLADSGHKVFLLDSSPTLGGYVAQLGFMFPSHDCILCRGTAEPGFGCSRPTISPFLLDHSRHPNIEIMTNTTVVGLSGLPGDLAVGLVHRPRYVEPSLCTNCGECAAACPVELPSQFEAGMAKRKAAYKPAIRSAPNAYVVEKGPYCEGCGKCAAACPTKAIDLEEKERWEELHVGALILTPGYQLYDPARAEELGYGRFPNVLTGLQFERLTSRSGPTEGALRRPSDGKVPQQIAWLQCVGSRDQEHPYCSSICCMYATKEAILAKQRVDGVGCEVFFMDHRSFGKEYTPYFEQSKKEWGIGYTRCRLSEIKEDPASRDLIVHYTDDSGAQLSKRFDMVVLSVGSEPPVSGKALAHDLQIDLNQYGFCQTGELAPLDTSREGVLVAGAFASPKEISETVMDASGAAARCLALLPDDDGGEVTRPAYPPERDVSGEAPRVGVLACRCHPTIDGVIDLDRVLQSSASYAGVVHVQALDYGCLGGGPEEIGRAIREHGLNRVVLGACTSRTHLALFQDVLRRQGLNPQLLEFVSLRDNCAWVHGDDAQGATHQATEEMRVAVARARHLKAFGKERRGCERAALVVGGGLSGMTAALSLADEGVQVTLVEKSGELGGNLRSLTRTAGGADPQQLLGSLIERVQAHPQIAVHMHTQVASHSGSVGQFRARLRSDGNGDGPREWEIEHGVAVVATGGQEYRGPAWGLGSDPRIITQQDLERTLGTGSPAKASTPKTTVMLQCVGPWDEAGSKAKFYCSRTCCTQAVKNAIALKEGDPDCQVVILHKDLMTYGFREQYYTEARRRGVIFVRFDEGSAPQVKVEQGRLQVEARDAALDRQLALAPDLLVLSTATLPADTNAELAGLLQVPLSGDGFFMEDNLKLRPMDFTRTGVFLAGLAHYPKFIEESISQSLATAARAMTFLSKEQLEVGGAIAIVDQAKCVGCLTCVRVCPFQVPRIDATAVGNGKIMGAAYIEPSMCTGCGVCTSECPANAIQLQHYRDDELVLDDEPILGQWLPA